MNIAELFNMPEFWKCVYESAPIIDEKSAIEVGIPNEAANRAYNEVREIRGFALLCMVCGSQPYVHECDEDGCWKYDEEVGHEYDTWCIASADLGMSTKWNICSNCQTYHHVCRVCNRYCKLASHGGCFVRKNPKNSKDDIWINNNGSDEYTMPINSKIKYMSRFIVFPTGTDGGLSHEWKCDNEECAKYGKSNVYSDK